MTFRIIGILGLITISLTIGWLGAVSATADVVPMRRGQSCIAWDTADGRVAGEWQSGGTRCAIRDWRMQNPLYGLRSFLKRGNPDE
jgi:hypothetical protein